MQVNGLLDLNRYEQGERMVVVGEINLLEQKMVKLYVNIIKICVEI